MSGPDHESRLPPQRQLSLRPGQAWFLAAAALAVILFFAFVILPYVDSKPTKLSGEKLAEFDLEVIGGQPGARLALSELRGRPVVLDFWASWCQPCRAQSAALSAVTDRLGGELHFVGVATGDEKEAATRFVEQHQPSYVNVFDESGVVARSLGVRTLPTLVVLDGSGTVRAISSRVYSESELEDHVRQVLR